MRVRYSFSSKRTGHLENIDKQRKLDFDRLPPVFQALNLSRRINSLYKASIDPTTSTVEQLKANSEMLDLQRQQLGFKFNNREQQDSNAKIGLFRYGSEGMQTTVPQQQLELLRRLANIMETTPRATGQAVAEELSRSTFND